MATPTITIVSISAPAPWAAAGDTLNVSINGPRTSAPSVTIRVQWTTPSGPFTDPLNAITFSFNTKWAGFVVSRTLNMSMSGPGGAASGPIVLSPSSSQQFKQFQLAFTGMQVSDLVAGINLTLRGTSGPQVSGADSVGDWSLFFSSMVMQAFTGPDGGTTPPPSFGTNYLTQGPATTFNVLSNQNVGVSLVPFIHTLIDTTGGTVPVNGQGVIWSIATVGGVQPATLNGFNTGNTSSDATGLVPCTTPIHISATFTGTFQLVATPTAGTWANSPARFTYNVWPIPAGGAAAPTFTLTGGGGHWCVGDQPDFVPVQFDASPGYNISVAFGSFVNVSGITVVDSTNVAAAPFIQQVDITGNWYTSNNNSFFRPNYSGVANTGSYVATFTIRSPDNLTVCGTIPVTINVARNTAFLPLQNFNALQMFTEV